MPFSTQPSQRGFEPGRDMLKAVGVGLVNILIRDMKETTISGQDFQLLLTIAPYESQEVWLKTNMLQFTWS